MPPTMDPIFHPSIPFEDAVRFFSKRNEKEDNRYDELAHYLLNGRPHTEATSDIDRMYLSHVKEFLEKFEKDTTDVGLLELLRQWVEGTLQKPNKSQEILGNVGQDDDPYVVARKVLHELKEIDDICSFFSFILHYQGRARTSTSLTGVPFSIFKKSPQRLCQNYPIFNQLETKFPRKLITFNVTDWIEMLISKSDMKERIEAVLLIVGKFLDTECIKIASNVTNATDEDDLALAIVAFLSELNVIRDEDSEAHEILVCLLKDGDDFTIDDLTVILSVGCGTEIGCPTPISTDTANHVDVSVHTAVGSISQSTHNIEQKRKRPSHDGMDDHKSKK